MWEDLLGSKVAYAAVAEVCYQRVRVIGVRMFQYRFEDLKDAIGLTL